MAPEYASREKKDEKPTKLFWQVYTRKNKDATVIPPLGSNTPLDDTTISSNDFFETNPEVYVPSPSTFKTATLNPQDGEQDRRYPLCDRKELDRLGFSKSSSNVVYHIFYFCLLSPI